MAFSATFTEDTLEEVAEFMRSPQRILMHQDDVSLLGVRQFYVLIDGESSISPCPPMPVTCPAGGCKPVV